MMMVSKSVRSLLMALLLLRVNSWDGLKCKCVNFTCKQLSTNEGVDMPPLHVKHRLTRCSPGMRCKPGSWRFSFLMGSIGTSRLSCTHLMYSTFMCKESSRIVVPQGVWSPTYFMYSVFGNYKTYLHEASVKRYVPLTCKGLYTKPYAGVYNFKTLST